MVIDIKMCRFDNVPWGFRLVGGSDYDYPLTVVKITEGSIADNAGLKVDDVIVRINDTAASPLSHDEANQIIRNCGNVFYFGVFRENEDVEAVISGPQKFPLRASVIEVPLLSKISTDEKCKSPVSDLTSEDDFRNNLYIPDLPDRPCSVLSEGTEVKLVEEEIAAVLSGETEVLKDHQVLGIFPKPGVCMASDVLRSLNEAATKTRAEKEQEIRKWSTFLQKPDRPIPKSKQQLEAERRAANAYKVKIVKSAPRSERDKTPLVPERKESESESKEKKPKDQLDEQLEPVVSSSPSVDTVILADSPKERAEEEEEPVEPIADSEVPNLEEIIPESNGTNETSALQPDNAELKEEIEDEHIEFKKSEAEGGEDGDGDVEGGETSKDKEITKVDSESSVIIEKTEEELILEKQLSDVQQQLAALSTLPSTIKSTLDAVTKQLAELLPTFKLEPIKVEEQISPEAALEDENKEEQQQQQLIIDSEQQSVIQADELANQGNDKDDMEVETISRSKELSDRQPQDKEMQTSIDTSKKERKHDVIEELEMHFGRKKNPKRSKRAFGPLTPSSERPLVLPGGRRWYRPKDAYNDEFIAETLSAQAELITGSTLGCTFESALLGYDSRVNFMKYQKPERKIDLDRSEVYKVIHHLDRKPVRGIEVRPPLVAAESDIRQLAQH